MQSSNNKVKILKKLSGFSGCSVFLCNYDSGYFVRKISQSVAYNARLAVQCQKQEAFCPTHLIKTPKILNKGFIDDLYFFDMEFVKGVTLAGSLVSLSAKKTEKIVKRIVYQEVTMEKVNVLDEELYFKKVQSLKERIGEGGIFSDVFRLLTTMDFDHLFSSDCHGDLTLENIIIPSDSDSVYLIDFLDSFLNSWMVDVAKILQDIFIGWSFRNLPHDDNLVLRCAILTEMLNRQLLRIDTSGRCMRNVYLLLLLNILRIYPYTTDAVTRLFLNQSLMKTYNFIRSL